MVSCVAGVRIKLIPNGLGLSASFSAHTFRRAFLRYTDASFPTLCRGACGSYNSIWYKPSSVTLAKSLLNSRGCSSDTKQSEDFQRLVPLYPKAVRATSLTEEA